MEHSVFISYPTSSTCHHRLSNARNGQEQPNRHACRSRTASPPTSLASTQRWGRRSQELLILGTCLSHIYVPWSKLAKELFMIAISSIVSIQTGLSRLRGKVVLCESITVDLLLILVARHLPSSSPEGRAVGKSWPAYSPHPIYCFIFRWPSSELYIQSRPIRYGKPQKEFHDYVDSISFPSRSPLPSPSRGSSSNQASWTRTQA